MNQLKRLKAEQAGQREDQPAPPRPGAASIRAAQKNPLMRLKRQQADPAGQPEAPLVPAVRAAVLAVPTLEQCQATIDAAQAAWTVHPALSPERTEAKRALLRQIMPHVEDYIDRHAAYPNSVAVEAMILLFDTGDIERALSLGLVLAAQDCHYLPKRFEGKALRPFIVKAMCEWASAKLKEGQPAAPYLEQFICAIDAGSGRWELPTVEVPGETERGDVRRGELYALAAKHAAQDQDYQAALAWCMKAEKANPRAGVKQLAAKCRAALAAAGEAPDSSVDIGA